MLKHLGALLGSTVVAMLGSGLVGELVDSSGSYPIIPSFIGYGYLGMIVAPIIYTLTAITVAYVRRRKRKAGTESQSSAHTAAVITIIFTIPVAVLFVKVMRMM